MTNNKRHYSMQKHGLCLNDNQIINRLIKIYDELCFTHVGKYFNHLRYMQPKHSTCRYKSGCENCLVPKHIKMN